MVLQEKKPGESIDSILRKFKRKVKSEGVLQAFKDREFFEKKSETKKKKARAAVRRNRIQQMEDDL